uniref:Ig-like domain-containing protein n=1 Tax=Tetranychus urticae TaxID=32264 RepID=T1KG53_TETUR
MHFALPPSLVIESVKQDDAGEYRCRIDFRQARTQYRTVQLEVIIGPREVIIMDEFGQRLRDLVGPYNEGAHLTLYCEAEGGSPQPELRWYKDGRLIDETWNITVQGIIRNELLINRIQRSDLMSTLTCIANNSNLTKSVSTSITLDLNLRPTNVRIISPKRALSAGKRVELKCTSEGSRPSAIVTWWKGPKRLQHVTEDVTSSENLTTSVVHFTPTAEDNGKILSCRADHSILPDSAIDDSWVLDVYFVPKLSLSLGSNLYYDQIRELTDVTFECHVIANPPISSVSWQFNGRSINSNSLGSVDLIFRNFSLTIRNITRHQSGKYRCVALNVEGDGYSHEINLRVLYSPICAPNQKVVYGLATKEPIKVPCTVEADPSQVTFRWALNNSHTLIPIKSFVSSRLTSLATYAPRTKFGYGQLYCWASNIVGEQREPCVFNVIPAGLPEPIKNCLVGNQSMDSLVIKCEPGQDGGLEQSFYLEVYHSITGLLFTNLTSTPSPIFEVNSLPKGTPFLLLLYAANSKGRSDSVALTASTLPFPSRTDINIITPVIAALISVIGSLVFTAIAIMIIARIRNFDDDKDSRSRQNSSRQPHNPTPPHSMPHKPNGHTLINTEEETLNIETTQTIDSWNTDLNHGDKYILAHETSENGFDISKEDGLVKLALDQRITPDGDAYYDQAGSESGSTMSTNQGDSINGGKRLSRYLLPSQTIMREPSVIILNEDEPLAVNETPLMNGLYFSYQRNSSQKQITPLSTPV